MGKNRHGRNGADVAVTVPVGTVVRDANTGQLIADMTDPDGELVLLGGGRGGRGNARFATATRQAPDWAERGQPGEERELLLELKLIADVGLVGLPNAGKSTLLSRLSSAHPKIADYPFTTLAPCLGIVALGEFGSFAMADIPGLIEGAHKGRGLGFRFLRHIERTSILLFLVDASSGHPQQDLVTLRKELGLYSQQLLDRPRIIALTKMDLVGQAPVPRLEVDGDVPVVEISSVTGKGLKELVALLGRTLEAAAKKEHPRGTPAS
jgi:GTP-binding protein